MDAPAKSPIKPLWVGVALFVLPPLGLYLLWKHPVLSSRRPWWIAGCVWGVIWLTSAFTPSETKEAEDGGGTASTASAEDSGVTRRTIGKPLTEKQMATAYSKAKTLTLGMSQKQVFALLGKPTKHMHTDFSKQATNIQKFQEFTGQTTNVPDPLDQFTWSMEGDPNSFVLVALTNDRLTDVTVNEGLGNVTFQLP